VVIHNLPQRYGKEPYPNTSSDWEKVAIELMKRGVFLFGGGLALYLFIKLLEE
jgi:hypothetical protein